jgi:hypothetical protein
VSRPEAPALRVAGERALGGAQLAQLGGFEEINLSAGLDIAAAGGDGGAHLRPRSAVPAAGRR